MLEAWSMKKLTEIEWVTAFEEIHGRKPKHAEFMEGLKNAEFQIIDSQSRLLSKHNNSLQFN